MRFHACARVLALLAWCACAPPAATSGPAQSPGLHGGVRLPPDPTVAGGRFVPVDVPREEGVGTEPGGGVRAIESGVRVVALPGGAMLAADDRFASAPTQVLALPERLGGGFLFVVGTTVWRAEKWLGPTRAVYASPARIGRVIGGRSMPGLFAGLDRVYVQSEHDVWRAIDGERGGEVPLGPWPASPSVGAFTAADGWRALASADLRGTIATFDAGATWRALHAPPDEREAKLLADTTPTSSRGEPTARAPDEPGPAGAGDGGPLGARPLAAAIEDGWPAGDDTALVARDGALARVRLDDGTIVDLDPDAYPSRPSRCHAIPLGPPGSLGFACGEPRGATIVYAFDRVHGRMVEDRRFDSPRVVLASGSGAVAVRGSCVASAPSDEPGVHAYCVRALDATWRETRLTGALGERAAHDGRDHDSSRGAERIATPVRERVVALADGRLALVWPPSDVVGPRLLLVDGAQVRAVPIALPDATAEVRRALDEGAWLDGFEERRPGVLGGWIVSAGSVLGVEIGLDGAARFGAFVRDAGSRIVAGRYGLGWTRGHVALETTDGGMTWTSIDGPAPLEQEPDVAACGPLGCEAAGWLRIGWHEPKRAAPGPAPSGMREPPVYPLPMLALACEASSDKGRDPLAAFPAPATTQEETLRVLRALDLRDGRDLDPRTTALARVQAWGPTGGDWERFGRWSVQWASPFAGVDGAHTTLPSPAPPLVAAIERTGAAMATQWAVAAGEDPSRALLVAQANARDMSTLALFELEADRAPLAIAGPSGDPLGRIDAAVEAGGIWYLASHASASESIVWRVDGARARELARVPRWFERGRNGAPAPRLAIRTDGRALGFVVDGGPTGAQPTGARWVLPIDLETGVAGDVELLGSVDLRDPAAMGACGPDDVGYRFDVPLLGSFALVEPSGPAGLSSALARVRLGAGRACIERLAARITSLRAAPVAAHAKAPDVPKTTPSLTLATSSDDARDLHARRCVVHASGSRQVMAQ